MAALSNPGKVKSEKPLFSREVRNEKMSQLRKTISRRLVEAKNTTAMLTTFNEVDMSSINEIRNKYKEKFKEIHGVNLGFMSFFTLALPFALRIVLPALNTIEADYGRLACALNLSGMAKWRWLILPRLRAPLGFAAGLVAALSMGDLGVVALFAGEAGVTLPLLIQRLMGAYRMDAAAGVALVLIAASFAAFWLPDREGRRHADA